VTDSGTAASVGLAWVFGAQGGLSRKAKAVEKTNDALPLEYQERAVNGLQ
jgi:hypothetical protein